MSNGRAAAWFAFMLMLASVLGATMVQYGVPWWARSVVTFGIGWTVAGYVIRERKRKR